MHQKTTMKLLQTINPELVTPEELQSYRVRQAARAVVFDNEGRVAILFASKHNYYKLPGGGVEEGEEYKEALHRECLEEIGCDIEVTSELGIIEEYRRFETLKQISYCYVAKLKGEKGVPVFTPEEIAEGFINLWLPYNEALDLISQNKATDIEGHAYIVPRDGTFLKEAQTYIPNSHK